MKPEAAFYSKLHILNSIVENKISFIKVELRREISGSYVGMYKDVVFWIVPSRRLVEIYRRFRGYLLPLSSPFTRAIF
jgi:hypothetical protein